MLFDKLYGKIHALISLLFLSFWSQNIMPAAISQYFTLRETKMKFHKMDDFGLQTTSKSHTLTWKNENGILSVENDLLLQGSL